MALIDFIVCVAFLVTAFRLSRPGALTPAKLRARWIEVCLVWLIGVPILVFPLLVVTGDWPPLFWERHSQRQTVLKRMEAAGGWKALQEGCLRLAKENEEMGIQWFHGRIHAADANYQMPPVLMALKPASIDYLPARYASQSGRDAGVEVVRIYIYGMHATGGRSRPYYGLEVVWGPGAKNYRPKPSEAASGIAHYDSHLATENIYELY